jgi:hypothetical protein
MVKIGHQICLSIGSKIWKMMRMNIKKLTDMEEVIMIQAKTMIPKKAKEPQV